MSKILKTPRNEIIFRVGSSNAGRIVNTESGVHLIAKHTHADDVNCGVLTCRCIDDLQDIFDAAYALYSGRLATHSQPELPVGSSNATPFNLLVRTLPSLPVPQGDHAVGGGLLYAFSSAGLTTDRAPLRDSFIFNGISWSTLQQSGTMQGVVSGLTSGTQSNSFYAILASYKTHGSTTFYDQSNPSSSVVMPTTMFMCDFLYRRAWVALAYRYPTSSPRMGAHVIGEGNGGFVAGGVHGSFEISDLITRITYQGFLNETANLPAPRHTGVNVGTSATFLLVGGYNCRGSADVANRWHEFRLNTGVTYSLGSSASVAINGTPTFISCYETITFGSTHRCVFIATATTDSSGGPTGYTGMWLNNNFITLQHVAPENKFYVACGTKENANALLAAGGYTARTSGAQTPYNFTTFSSSVHFYYSTPFTPVYTFFDGVQGVFVDSSMLSSLLTTTTEAMTGVGVQYNPLTTVTLSTFDGPITHNAFNTGPLASFRDLSTGAKGVFLQLCVKTSNVRLTVARTALAACGSGLLDALIAGGLRSNNSNLQPVATAERLTGVSIATVANLPTSRYGCALTGSSRNALLLGGNTSSSILTDNVSFFNGNAWATFNSLPAPCSFAGVSYLQGGALLCRVMGGVRTNENSSASTYFYNGLAWTSGSTLLIARSNCWGMEGVLSSVCVGTSPTNEWRNQYAEYFNGTAFALGLFCPRGPIDRCAGNMLQGVLTSTASTETSAQTVVQFVNSRSRTRNFVTTLSVGRQNFAACGMSYMHAIFAGGAAPAPNNQTTLIDSIEYIESI